jgi:hypothetical protein
MPAFDDDPGVGPVVSLTYRATVDIPVRRGGVWADVFQGSIGRGGLERQNIALWR